MLSLGNPIPPSCVLIERFTRTFFARRYEKALHRSTNWYRLWNLNDSTSNVVWYEKKLLSFAIDSRVQDFQVEVSASSTYLIMMLYFRSQRDWYQNECVGQYKDFPY